MVEMLNSVVAVIGIDIGKSSFHALASMGVVPSCCGRDGRGAKWNHRHLDETLLRHTAGPSLGHPGGP
jgi:hypothetical protein